MTFLRQKLDSFQQYVASCEFTYHVVALRTFPAKGHRRISRVLATFHRCRLQTLDVFPAAVLAGHVERRSPDVGARNEFNSTALRNWLRSHSSGKFLIVCPAPSGEFARSRRGDGRRSPPAGLTTSIYVQDAAGVSQVFRVVSRTSVPLAC